MTQPRVLFVDDDVFQLELADDLFTRAGFSVEVVRQPTLAFSAIRRFRPDLVVLDMAMPVMDGNELIRGLNALPDLTRFAWVVLSAAVTPERAFAWVASGAFDVWTKPLDESMASHAHDLLQAGLSLPTRHEQKRWAFRTYARRSQFSGTITAEAGTPFEISASFERGELTRLASSRGPGDQTLDELLASATALQVLPAT